MNIRFISDLSEDYQPITNSQDIGAMLELVGKKKLDRGLYGCLFVRYTEDGIGNLYGCYSAVPRDTSLAIHLI